MELNFKSDAEASLGTTLEAIEALAAAPVALPTDAEIDAIEAQRVSDKDLDAAAADLGLSRKAY